MTKHGDDDNLVQLPIGARFGLDHEPSPQEREELVRFAAAADAELRGSAQADGQAQDEDDEPRSAQAGPDAEE